MVGVLDLDRGEFSLIKAEVLVDFDLGLVPRFVRRTLDEDERYEIFIDWSGIKMKRLKTST